MLRIHTADLALGVGLKRVSWMSVWPRQRSERRCRRDLHPHHMKLESLGKWSFQIPLETRTNHAWPELAKGEALRGAKGEVVPEGPGEALRFCAGRASDQQGLHPH